MNDGSKATLKEAVESFLPAGHNLTDGQIDDLTNFVGSIGNEGEIYGVDVVTFTDQTGALSYVKLKTGSVLSEITVIKQFSSDKKAKITVTLFDPNGKSLETYSGNIGSMNLKEITSVKPDINIPENLEKGSYYIISITDTGGKKLAADYKVIYQED